MAYSPAYTAEEFHQAQSTYQQCVSDGFADVRAGALVRFGIKSALVEAARRLDWSQDRVKRVLNTAVNKAAATPEYKAPVLPGPDIPLDDLVRQMAAEQKRQRAYRNAAEWMPYTVTGEAPFALAFVGDPHIDVCDIERLCAHLDLIEATPRMWAVGLGDWLNSWAPKLQGQYAHQMVTQRNGIRLAEWVLSRDIWWLLLLGNHDGERWHGHNNPLRWMQTACPVPVQEWQSKFTIRCGDATWRVWAAHNFPGNSSFNANHGPDKRALHTGAMADLYIAGDRHTFKLSQDQHEHTGRVFWSARARGYKPLDTYALEGGHGEAGGEKGIGHTITGVFDPRDGSLVCFAEVEKAAAYLATISRVRVRAGSAAA